MVKILSFYLYPQRSHRGVKNDVKRFEKVVFGCGRLGGCTAAHHNSYQFVIVCRCALWPPPASSAIRCCLLSRWLRYCDIAHCTCRTRRIWRSCWYDTFDKVYRWTVNAVSDRAARVVPLAAYRPVRAARERPIPDKWKLAVYTANYSIFLFDKKFFEHQI